MIKFFIVVFSVGVVGNLAAQRCAVGGRVLVEGAQPCEGCIVQVLGKDSTTLLAFTYTDSVGRAWMRLFTRQSRLLIAVSQFGYRDTMLSVRCGAGDSVFFEVQLRVLSIALDEVTVIDKAALLSKRGDTTTFHLRAIQQGNEVTAYDIARRLPGVDIDDRRLKYHGKEIAQILIEDLDVAHANQVRLLEQIRYDRIEKIQIIENQNIDKALDIDSARLQMIMKIDLKDSLSNRWKEMYTVVAGTGYDRVYTLKGSGIVIGEKWGLRAEAVLNNAYEKTITPQVDEIVDGILVRAQLDNRLKRLYEYTHPSNIMNDRLFSKVEREARIVFTRQSEQSTFKSSHAVAQLRGHQYSQQKEYYFINGQYFHTDQRGSIGRTYLYSNTSYLYYRKGFTFYMYLPFNGVFDAADRQMRISNVRGSYSSAEQFRLQRLSLSPHYRVEYARGNLIYKFLGRITGVRRGVHAEYISEDVRFHTMKINPEQADFGQEGIYEGLGGEHQLQVTYTKGKLRLEYAAFYVHRRERIEAMGKNIADPSFSGGNRLIRHGASQVGNVVLSFRRFRLSGGLWSYRYFDRSFAGKWTDKGIAPHVFGMVYLSSKWRLSMSYRVKAVLPVLEQLKTPALLMDRQRYEEGGLPLGVREFRRGVNLSLFKAFETGEGAYNVNVSATYTFPYQTYIYALDASSALTSTRWTLSTVLDERKLSAFYTYHKRWWSTSAHFLALARLYERNGQMHKQYDYNLNVRITYKGRRIHASQVVRLQMWRVSRELPQWFTTVQFAGSLGYNHRQFSQYVHLGFYSTRVAGVWKARPIVSLYSIYRIPKAEAEVSLRLSNITQWGRSTVTTISANPSAIVQREEALQSGDAMLVVKKLF